jgi:sec-independent protein translocase protein TatC
METVEGLTTKKKKEKKKPDLKKVPPTAGQMTFMEHLKELRNRIIVIALTILVTVTISWFFHEQIVQLFIDLGNSAAPAGKTFDFISTSVIGPFAVYFNVSFVTGVLLASPMIVYQLLGFLAPALEPESDPGEPGYEQELALLNGVKRSLWFMIPGLVMSFALGVLFAYYLVLPPALKFLLNFPGGQIQVLPEAQNLVNTCTQVMFWCGAVFQMPLIMFLLARLRILSWKQMVGWWKYALVFSMVIAALVNPSPDVVIQFIVSIPIYGLYWLGVLLARFA